VYPVRGGGRYCNKHTKILEMFADYYFLGKTFEVIMGADAPIPPKDACRRPVGRPAAASIPFMGSVEIIPKASFCRIARVTPSLPQRGGTPGGQAPLTPHYC